MPRTPFSKIGGMRLSIRRGASAGFAAVRSLHFDIADFA